MLGGKLKPIGVGAYALLVAAIGVFAFFMGIDIGHLNTHYAERAEYHSEQYAGHTKERIESECAEFQPPRLYECIEEIIDASREAQRGENDLSAQQTMADWTIRMFLASVGGLVISVFALLALLRSLGQTETAIVDNREVGEAQVRAYLGISSIKVRRENKQVGLGVIPGRVVFHIDIVVTNSGNSPARNTELSFSIVNRGLRDKPELGRNHFGKHRFFVGANDTYVSQEGVMFHISKGGRLWAKVKDSSKFVKGQKVYLDGRLEYSDCFGRRRFSEWSFAFTEDFLERGYAGLPTLDRGRDMMTLEYIFITEEELVGTD